ncbi:MAG TPA: hypothetical protein VFV00_19455 [Acidimicrobiales bacterium]|nr:hypothetical protein [Acidimicrobiales bacterium]
MSDPVLNAKADEGVESNARLTATNGAVIFVLLAIEGLTVVSVGSLLRIHVVIGMALAPPVILKIGSTTYRAARYYLSAPAYQRRGPPPLVLRLIGPFVVVLTVAVIGTGIVLLALGSDHRSPWLQFHKASFILWFAAMTAHVLGHIVETARVAPRDWAPGAVRVRGTALRRTAVLAALVAGLALGALLQPLATDWKSTQDKAHRSLPARPPTAPR